MLLVKHTYGKKNWELPGGIAEVNESAQETAQREVLEETGVVVEIGELTGVYYDPNHDGHHFAFKSEKMDNKIPTPSSTEISECSYWAFNQLPKPISDFTMQRIEDSLYTDEKELFHSIGPRKWTE